MFRASVIVRVSRDNPVMVWYFGLLLPDADEGVEIIILARFFLDTHTEG
jgi:hypothetical protein